MPESIDEATWHEQAHVRGMALEYALGMLQGGVLTVDNYLVEAGRYWQFLRDGTVVELVDAVDVPDDLSGMEVWPEGMLETLVDIPSDEIPLPPEPPES